MKQKQYDKYLKQNIWFHGTTLSGWKELCKYKVKCDYNKGTELDFGYGFYLTPRFQQAENYINRMLPYLDVESEGDKKAVVIEFELNLYEIKEGYKHTCFLHHDEVFAEFILKNRMYPDAVNHDFDFIIGVMSDSNPEGLLADFRAGRITREDLITTLEKWNSMEQLSLHKQSVCDILTVRKAILTENGKELDVNDYNQK